MNELYKNGLILVTCVAFTPEWIQARVDNKLRDLENLQEALDEL